MASEDKKEFVATQASVPDKSQVPMATIHDDDERLLNQIGYTQVASLQSSSGMSTC